MTHVEDWIGWSLNGCEFMLSLTLALVIIRDVGTEK